jgi:hypothetical protein
MAARRHPLPTVPGAVPAAGTVMSVAVPARPLSRRSQAISPVMIVCPAGPASDPDAYDGDVTARVGKERRRGRGAPMRVHRGWGVGVQRVASGEGKRSDICWCGEL